MMWGHDKNIFLPSESECEYSRICIGESSRAMVDGWGMTQEVTNSQATIKTLYLVPLSFKLVQQCRDVLNSVGDTVKVTFLSTRTTSVADIRWHGTLIYR